MTPEAAPTAMLEIEGLKKSYGKLTAVADLSLTVNRGEVFGFLGPNGAGKTTTIHMVCGLLRPDSGTIRVAGHTIGSEYRLCKSRIGLCPQDLVIWESLTCREQLEMMGRLYDLNRREAARRGRMLLDVLGLSDRADRLAKTLSGGMKRRLNLALAVVHDPEILILDEPQAGLDPQSRILVREYIRDLAARKTVVLTTHDMDEADRMADRIAIIDHGRLLALDTPAGLKNRIGHGDILEVELLPGQHKKITDLLRHLPEGFPSPVLENDRLRVTGLQMGQAVTMLFELLENRRIGIQDLTIRKKTLEDVFIALTGRRLRE